MKILIVDDSMAMRLIVKKTLRDAGYTGHEIVEASDGDEALAKIDESRPDIILSDWNMPNRTGPELLEQLNEWGDTPTFGFITTEATPKMRAIADELGAKFLIAKPFTVSSFNQALDEYLG
ncbi:MAG: response regulator [Pseudomonadales bacterium]|nr:response regulator [Pseudomonadales bacterium]MCP5185275.1 response regulator [Pseudomonadales bacterium]